MFVRLFGIASTRLGFSVALCAIGWAFVVVPLARAAPDWPVIPASELAETKPQVEADAPAEVTYMRYEFDDRDFPRSRTLKEYVRFKIFAPDRAQNITRISLADSANTDSLDVRARLTLPDGSVREFGPEAVKERTLAREGRAAGLLGWLAASGTETKEKFLAIAGVEPGAVLEYRVARDISSPSRVHSLRIQRELIPVRRVEYIAQTCSPRTGWESKTFVTNRLSGELKRSDRGDGFTFTATNVPSIVPEPFMGPFSDYAMTVVTTVDPLRRQLLSRSGHVPIPERVDGKLGPWAFDSTTMSWFDRDRGYPTRRVRALANEITKGIANPEEKAKAIHAYVRTLFHAARLKPASRSPRLAESLDEIIDLDRYPDVARPALEFVWLAVGLCQASGLEAHTILLPDRQVARFKPEFVSPALLPHAAVAVHLGGDWKCFEPEWAVPLPFGLLPWQQEGQPALLALDHKQQFVEVPATGSDQSVISVTGKFVIDLGGTLTGTFERTFTGQSALQVRAALVRLGPVQRRRAARRFLSIDAKTAEFSQLEIANIDNPDAPVSISAHVKWPGYASRTRDRLIVRPAVFQAETKPVFTADERRYPISFPYHWSEKDRLTLEVPEGFAPESPTEEPALDAQVLYHRVQLAYDGQHRVLHVDREFRNDLTDVRTEAYGAVKKCFEVVSKVDQRDIVFIGHNVPLPETKSDAAGAAGDDGKAADKTDADGDDNDTAGRPPEN